MGSIRRVSAPELEALVLKVLRDHQSDASNASSNLETIDLRVAMQKGSLDISWVNHSDVNRSSTIDPDAIDERRSVVVPYAPEPHKRRREIFVPAETASYVRPIAGDEWTRLVLAIARGKAWLRDVLAGLSTEAIAAREGKSERAIRLTLSLAFLDPKLVKAALQGALPQGVSARRLLDAPVDWHDQWRAVGLARPA